MKTTRTPAFAPPWRGAQIFIAAVTCAMTLVSIIHAEQGGTGHYVQGATADFADATPGQPGWVGYNVFMDYDNGTAGASAGLPFGGNIALNAIANAQAEIPVVFYTPDFRILGGLPSFAVALPFVAANVEATGIINSHGAQISAFRSDTATGLGDIEFWPLWLGWTNGDLKYDARCAVYAPSGGYSTGSLANTGLGYWTVEPMVEFSWLSSKIGTEVSAFTGLDFNSENTDANYKSGDIFHIDGTLAEHLPLFGGFVGAGASASYYKQFTDDTGTGARLGGFETKSYGIGPVISYVHKFGTSTLVFDAKWLPQTFSENTTKGNYFFVKLGYQF
jgi:hypothetical protein